LTKATASVRAKLKAEEQAAVLAELQQRPTTSLEFIGRGMLRYKLRIAQLRRPLNEGPDDPGWDIRSRKLNDGSHRFVLHGKKGQRKQLALFPEC